MERWIQSPRRDPCNLCRGEQFQQLSLLDRKGRELVTVVCGQCGLVSHEHIPNDRELEDYYLRQYRQEYHQEYTPSAYRVVREWKRGGHLVEMLQPFLESSDRVLEIGSGIGCTVKQFELAGFASSGIEPGDGFCRFSGERLHARVRQASLADLSRKPEAELVMLVHVLEHLNNPQQALQHMRELLTDAGQLYVEVPNFGLPHAAPGKLFHFAHIYNFTSATLKMLGRSSGFEVEAELSSETDRNLRILFRKSRTAAWNLDSESYRNSIEAFTRYNVWSYHLRWSYLSERLKTVWRHRRERWQAASGLARLEQSCVAGEKGMQRPGSDGLQAA